MSKFRIPILALLCASAVAAFLFQVGRGESPDAFANHVVDCLNNRDADCMQQQVGDLELAAYQSDRQRLPDFFKEYVFPTLPNGKISILHGEPSPQDPNHVFYKIGNVPEQWSVDIEVQRAEGRIGSPQLLSATIMAAGQDRHRRIYDLASTDLKGLVAMHEIATKDAKQLEELGIHGYMRSSEEGLLSFSALKAKTEENMAKILNGHNPSKPLR